MHFNVSTEMSRISIASARCIICLSNVARKLEHLLHRQPQVYKTPCKCKNVKGNPNRAVKRYGLDSSDAIYALVGFG